MKAILPSCKNVFDLPPCGIHIRYYFKMTEYKKKEHKPNTDR